MHYNDFYKLIDNTHFKLKSIIDLYKTEINSYQSLYDENVIFKKKSISELFNSINFNLESPENILHKLQYLSGSNLSDISSYIDNKEKLLSIEKKLYQSQEDFDDLNVKLHNSEKKYLALKANLDSFQHNLNTYKNIKKYSIFFQSKNLSAIKFQSIKNSWPIVKFFNYEKKHLFITMKLFDAEIFNNSDPLNIINDKKSSDYELIIDLLIQNGKEYLTLEQLVKEAESDYLLIQEKVIQKQITASNIEDLNIENWRLEFKNLIITELKKYNYLHSSMDKLGLQEQSELHLISSFKNDVISSILDGLIKHRNELENQITELSPLLSFLKKAKLTRGNEAVKDFNEKDFLSSFENIVDHNNKLLKWANIRSPYIHEFSDKNSSYLSLIEHLFINDFGDESSNGSPLLKGELLDTNNKLKCKFLGIQDKVNLNSLITNSISVTASFDWANTISSISSSFSASSSGSSSGSFSFSDSSSGCGSSSSSNSSDGGC